MYTHFLISRRLVFIPMALLSLKMALLVPQNGPNVNMVIFVYIKKGFYCESFGEGFGSF